MADSLCLFSQSFRAKKMYRESFFISALADLNQIAAL